MKEIKSQINPAMTKNNNKKKNLDKLDSKHKWKKDKMCRNHRLTSFGPLRLCASETTEDINCPGRGRRPLGLCPEKTKGEEAKRGEEEKVWGERV